MGLLMVREGEGEKDALPSLVYRLATHLGVELPYLASKEPWRKPLVTETHVREVGEQARALPGCEGLLLTRDADNDDLPVADCPKFNAPVVRKLASYEFTKTEFSYIERDNGIEHEIGVPEQRDEVAEEDLLLELPPETVPPVMPSKVGSTDRGERDHR